MNLNRNNRKREKYLTCLTGSTYKGISAYLDQKKSKVIEKGYQDMPFHQNLLKYRLYKVNWTCEIDILTKIIDFIKL